MRTRQHKGERERAKESKQTQGSRCEKNGRQGNTKKTKGAQGSIKVAQRGVEKGPNKGKQGNTGESKRLQGREQLSKPTELQKVLHWFPAIYFKNHP